MFNHLYIDVKAPVEFVLSLARMSKVRIKRVIKTKKGCSFYISSKDFEIFKDTLTKHQKEYFITKNYSVKTFFSRNLVRYGFYAAFFIAFIIIFFYSTNATRLQIEGNSLVDTQIIVDTVKSVVLLPSSKKNIDRNEIIKKIVTLEGISNASVELKGNTIFVKVYEELGKVEISDPNDFGPILSKFDAVVTRIITYSGEAVIKKGQAVQKGDKLITSEKVLQEGIICKEKALGDIYGRVWYAKSLVIPPSIMVNQRTGKKEIYNFTFFNFSKKYKGNFANYEIEKSSYLLPCIFPFKISTYTYFETKSREIEWDYDSNKQGIIKNNTQLLENALPEKVIKLRTWYVEKRVDKIVYLDIYYEVEMKIN